MFSSLITILCCTLLICTGAHVLREIEPSNAPNLFNLPNIRANNRTDLKIIQGDIAVPTNVGRTAYIASARWPSGIIPYVFDSGFTTSQQNIIIGAMNTIMQETNNCIRFVRRSIELNWVRIFSGSG
jgi:hypothetical protein